MSAKDMLIVEDGSGVVDANTYLTIADADTFHVLRRTAATWAAADDDSKAIALVAATAYVEKRYFGKWAGVRTYSLDGQQLSWPRLNVVILDSPEANSRRRYDIITKQFGQWIPYNVIPKQLKEACAILAGKALSEDLEPDQDRDDFVLSTSVAVGGIDESTSYRPGAPTRKIYRDAHDLIRMLLDGYGQTMRIARV